MDTTDATDRTNTNFLTTDGLYETPLMDRIPEKIEPGSTHQVNARKVSTVTPLEGERKTLHPLHVHSKVNSPGLPTTYLHRETLVQQLHSLIDASVAVPERKVHSLPYKLVLLHAPAGYGKTTLLVDFSQRTSLPCCWYFLDQSDTDGMTFLSVLLTSLRQRFPGFGQALDPLLTNSASPQLALQAERMSYFKKVVDMLISAMESEISEHFAILLCNYQEINGSLEINALIGYLLQKLPQHCVLVIESRIIPDLDFAQLLARQMISSIGIDQFRFTARQIYEWAGLQAVEAFSEADAEQLATTFDGWAAGILLGTRLSNLQQSRQGLVMPTLATSLEQQTSSHHLFSYVVNEVFKHHQAAYAFLRDACVLQEMTPLLCANLLDISPSQAHTQLQYLEQQNLFVTHRGEVPHFIYTCIPVVRNLLYEHLRSKAPEQFFQLHRRAAALLSTSQNYPQALYHALEANVNEISVEQIIEADEHMMNQGHAAILARWIDTFSPPAAHSYPQLLLIRVHIYLRQGDYTSALPLLDVADAYVQRMPRSSSLDKQNFLTLQAEIAIIRSRILFQQGEYQQGKLLCQQVLGSLSVDDAKRKRADQAHPYLSNKLSAYAHMRLGLCSLQMGDFPGGITHIQKALQLWGRHTIQRQTAEGHSALATAYSMLGNFTLAEHHITRALACWDHLHDIWGKIENYVTLGNIRLRQGASEAEGIFQEALAQARCQHFLRGQAYALSGLSLCYYRQERSERALEMAEEALALARQIHDHSLEDTVLCDLAMIYLAMGDTATPMILIAEVMTRTANDEPCGYKSTIGNLICGTIYLDQQQYALARSCLTTSEAALSKVDLKQEHLQSLLRLAACCLAQNQVPDALHSLQVATSIIPICPGYAQLALKELHHFPYLHQAVKTFPELESIRTLLQVELESTTGPTHQELLKAEAEKFPVSSASHAPASEKSRRGEGGSRKLSIRALGEPVVYLHQEPVTRWRMAHARELFFYLLDCHRPMRKDAIISSLWGEVNEQTTRTFYSTIYYLRQALGGESVIVAKGGTYTLKLDGLYGEDVWYDVAVFEDLQEQARQSLKAGHDEEARAAYLAMIDLYRGDYVQPFYGDWCGTRRDELRNAYLDAHHQLALIAWRAEQVDESVVHWQHMLAFDNWLEHAHYGLMRCYVHQGKRGQALRQYQLCRDILKQEFNTVPGSPIQNLYQRLVRQP